MRFKGRCFKGRGRENDLEGAEKQGGHFSISMSWEEGKRESQPRGRAAGENQVPDREGEEPFRKQVEDVRDYV